MCIFIFTCISYTQVSLCSNLKKIRTEVCNFQKSLKHIPYREMAVLFSTSDMEGNRKALWST